MAKKPHKYIRRYRGKDGKWKYVYHEPKSTPAKEYFDSILKITSGWQKEYLEAQKKMSKPVEIKSINDILPKDQVEKIKRLGLEVKQCYYNAYKISTTFPEIRYVEGLAFIHGIPIDHVWNELNGEHFDATEELVLKNKLLSDHVEILNLDNLELVRYAVETETSGPYFRLWFEEQQQNKKFKKSLVKLYINGKLSLDSFQKAFKNIQNLIPKKVNVKGKHGKTYQAIRWVNPYGDVKGREETKQKEEENQEQGKKFELKTYYVIFHTDTSSESLLETKDYDEAKYKFDDYGVNDLEDRMKNNPNMSVTLSSETNTYKFVFEDENPEDYPLEDYYDDPEVYELVDEGDFEDEECRSIEPANEKSEELLDDIQKHFYEKYGNYKYNMIEVLGNEDENGDYEVLGKIRLRIADHTENIHNVDRHEKGDYHISVVIADFDKTEQRFGFLNAMERRKGEFELKFDSDTNLEDAIYEIEQQIEECTEMIVDGF